MVWTRCRKNGSYFNKTKLWFNVTQKRTINSCCLSEKGPSHQHLPTNTPTPPPLLNYKEDQKAAAIYCYPTGSKSLNPPMGWSCHPAMQITAVLPEGAFAAARGALLHWWRWGAVISFSVVVDVQSFTPGMIAHHCSFPGIKATMALKDLPYGRYSRQGTPNPVKLLPQFSDETVRYGLGEHYKKYKRAATLQQLLQRQNNLNIQ